MRKKPRAVNLAHDMLNEIDRRLAEEKNANA